MTEGTPPTTPDPRRRPDVPTDGSYPWADAPPQQPYPAPVSPSTTQWAPPTGAPIVPAGAVPPPQPQPQPQYGAYAPGYGPAPGYAPAPGYTPGYAPPPGYPPGMGAPWPVEPPRPVPAPADRAEYQQVLRGPRRAWWRPLVSFLLVCVMVIAFTGVLLTAWMVGIAVTGGSVTAWLDEVEGSMSPSTFLFMNLSLAVLVPAAVLATRWAHGVRSGFFHSVAGRFRFGWFVECLMWLTPLWAVLMLASWLYDGRPAPEPHPRLWVMLAIVLLTTPLQCAGEEYLFRGWFLQNVGVYFRNRWAALLVPMIPSVALFALAHTSMDPWVLLDLGIFALVACLLAWRTGGLEAATAMHTVNNVAIMVTTLVMGGFDEGFVDTQTKGDPSDVVLSVALQGIALAVIVWRARVRRVQRLTDLAQPREAPGDTLGAPRETQGR